MAPLQRQQGATSGFWLIGGGGSKRFHGGPATAPGPRSLSTDSDRPRHLRKRNTSSTRGRLRSSSREVRSMGAEYHDEESTDSEPGRTIWRRSSSSGRQSPRSTKPSWLTGADTDSIVDSEPSSYADCDTNKHHTDSDMHLTSTQAAVGVLVSNVATAVVLWRAKPEDSHGVRILLALASPANNHDKTLATNSSSSRAAHVHFRHCLLQLHPLDRHGLSSFASTAVRSKPTFVYTATHRFSNSTTTSSIGDTAHKRDMTIIDHRILCILCILSVLPLGVLTARWMRTFTRHAVVQAVLSGPIIVAGVALGINAVEESKGIASGRLPSSSIIPDSHRLLPALSRALVGRLRHHFLKFKIPACRPAQNYAHALLGLLILVFAFWQIRTGEMREYPEWTTGWVSMGFLWRISRG
ncbi:hypothetical protein FIBSPDRAFT_1051227 [Athelia psychrophila]|uniref:Cytochrome b561 domain-containing protein n=1 Tax=Athelia psychrophila TaxID=1759441 RepID=A0A165ZH04_9AGAM|nr:hypothetical protein FIBSPDRAFT_1051227 [Fibularhizoctonia sp. CBS 109695]